MSDKNILADDLLWQEGVICFMVQESIKHFPIPLRKSLKVIAEGDFLDWLVFKKYLRGYLRETD